MATYFTIAPSFRSIASLRNVIKIEERIKDLQERDSLPAVHFHAQHDARRMADSGPGWIMIREEEGEFSTGINGTGKLYDLEQYTIEQILKVNKTTAKQ